MATSSEIQLVKVETSRGTVELSNDIVRRYFCANATDQEIAVFLKICEYQRLNPFLREIHMVKYGTQPATFIVGWHVFLMRAEGHPAFNGYTVEVFDEDDKPYRGRSGQKISHATAKVFRKDRQHPVEVTVLFKEYCVVNQQGQPMASWGKIPSTMIRKVALEQALREAFTKDFSGMYGPEEMGVAEELPEEEITQPLVVTAVVDDTIDHVPPASEPSPKKRPNVIAPLTASKYLTDLYGVTWMKHVINGKTVGEHYFGKEVKTFADLNTLQRVNKAAWDTGINRILRDAEAHKELEPDE